MSDLSDAAFKEWETSQPSIYNAVDLAREWRRRAEEQIEQRERLIREQQELIEDWVAFWTSHSDGDDAAIGLVERSKKIILR